MRRIQTWTLATMRVRMLMAAMGIAVFPAISSAALATHESFDYSTGPIFHKVSTTFGWRTSEYLAYGSGAPQVVSGSLSDPTGTLVTSGNMMTAPVAAQGDTWNGTVYTGVTNATGLDFNKDGTMSGTSTVRWTSMLIRQDASDATSSFGVQLGNTYKYVANLSIGVISGKFGAGISTAQANSNITPVVGTTYFLAMKFDWTDGAKPKLTLFVNPTPGLTAPADATGFSGTSSGNYGWGDSNTGLDNFTGNSSVNLVGKGYTIDELRFGDTFADVAPVPEPTTISLLGIGGLALLRRRRA